MLTEEFTSRKSIARKEWKVIPVKYPGKLFVVVLGIMLSGSVGFGAMMNVNGEIDPVDEYDVSVMDTAGESFATGLDIGAFYWGEDGDWYTIGMTVTDPPINTTGDGTYTSIRTTTVFLSLLQGVGGEKHAFEVRMRDGKVADFTMWDAVGDEINLTKDINLKYAIGNGLEFAVKKSAFENFDPASPFNFDLLFEGGGRNDDDDMQGTIPEPSTISLIVVGGLFTIVRRRRKRQAAR